LSDNTTPVIQNTETILINADPAVSEDGTVRFVVSKIWASLDLGRGSGKFNGGFSLIPDGKLVLPINVRKEEGIDELTTEEFKDVLAKLVSLIQPAAETFVQIQLNTLTYNPQNDF